MPMKITYLLKCLYLVCATLLDIICFVGIIFFNSNTILSYRPAFDTSNAF